MRKGHGEKRGQSERHCAGDGRDLVKLGGTRLSNICRGVAVSMTVLRDFVCYWTKPIHVQGSVLAGLGEPI